MKAATWNEKTTAAWQAKARTMPWHEFIGAYVAKRTARSSIQGYQVRAADGAWLLLFNGTAMFAPMNASTLYSWLERLPLMPLSREADNFRWTAHQVARMERAP